MKKVVFLALCGAAFLASCNSGTQSKDALQVQNDSLMLELANRDAELDEIMGSFNEIQEGFREINEAENRVDLQGVPSSLASNIPLFITPLRRYL